MDDELQPTYHERLVKLEAKVMEQEAQISGLRGAVADLLASQAILHKDTRHFSALHEYRNYDWKRAEAGGTERISKEFFETRGTMFADLMDDAANSILFSTYWRRSIVDWIDERRKKRLERTQRSIESYADGEIR